MIKTIRCCAPFVLLPLAMGVAQAQASEPEEEFLLEEIIITATRRAEGTSIMDTGLSVDAMTGTELEAKGYTSIMEALSSSPGVSVAENVNVGPAIQIRGVSAIVGAAVVGYYLDDLPYTRITGNVAPDLNPYDLNRVEVLRGPQGTLFGVGAQGGVVRVITQDPVMNEFSGKVTAGYATTGGGDDSNKLQGAINIPLIEDTLAMRVVAAQVNDGGYIDLTASGEDNYNETEDTSLRVKLLWTPTEELSVVASYWSSEREGHQNFADDNHQAVYTLTNFDTLFDLALGPALLPGYTPMLGVSEFAQVAGSELLKAETSNDLYGLKIEYVTDTYTFLSTTSYLEGSNLSGTIFDLPGLGSVASLVEYPKLDTFAQEFKLSSSNGGSWNWTLGTVYLDMENQDQTTTSFAAENPANWVVIGPLLSLAPEVVSPSTTTDSKSWAVFGETIHQIGEQWELTVGLRYYEDDRDQSGAESSSFDKVTGRINLTWTPTQDSLYYANIATGFRSGALNVETLIAAAATQTQPINVPSSIDPDEVISYEIGGKWTLLDGHLQLETVAYYLEWDDIQTLLYGVINNSLEGWAENANSAAGAGFEFVATYQYGGLNLSASGNWNGIEYEGDLPSAGISDGDAMMNVPELTWNAAATYTWPLGELTGMAFLSATYTDERSDYGPGMSYTTEDFTVLNARIGVESQQWSVFLTGSNITDENPEVSQLAILASLGADPVRMRPATYGVEFNYKF
ncbi:TonB-dependent receptor [Pseudomaricurvus alkylphenolicus]|uniref:TonB-dependent receptor n=1 Tax=Pseudomaricurvus alkylphenolicus TaxID=1306991 RepID=UPI001423A098|nr:TonB-dependent receptor [Pseudomaricurvus alkylphenolicus]NIB42430.1 TonB-dependent receptor [Pseudomaricurvus alkylphenolicus]